MFLVKEKKYFANFEAWKFGRVCSGASLIVHELTRYPKKIHPVNPIKALQSRPLSPLNPLGLLGVSVYALHNTFTEWYSALLEVIFNTINGPKGNPGKQ